MLNEYGMKVEKSALWILYWHLDILHRCSCILLHINLFFLIVLTLTKLWFSCSLAGCLTESQSLFLWGMFESKIFFKQIKARKSQQEMNRVNNICFLSLQIKRTDLSIYSLLSVSSLKRWAAILTTTCWTVFEYEWL